jgi:hypothetical protein
MNDTQHDVTINVRFLTVILTAAIFIVRLNVAILGVEEPTFKNLFSITDVLAE